MARHKLVIVSALMIIAAAGIAAGLLGAMLLHPDRYRSQIVAFLAAKTGKRIEIRHIAVQWLSGSVELDGFGVRNPVPFPAGYMFKAAKVDVVIKIAPLLRRRIAVESVVFYDPVINVISDPDGLWNFENPPSKTSSQPASIAALGEIPKATIVRGQLYGSSLIDPSDRPGPIVFEVHDLETSLVNVNLSAFAAQRSSPVATGVLNARSLRLGVVEVTRVKAKLRLLSKQVRFESVNVDADQGHATGELTFNLAGKNAQFTTEARLSDINVAQLLASFPGARGKMTGTMHGQFAVAGPIEHTLNPLAAIRGGGKLTVLDGELPGLNSNDSLKKMTRFRHPKDLGRNVSSFSSLSSDLDLTHQQMTNHDIDVAFYGFDLQCAGHLDLNGTGELAYHGVAKVLKKQGFVTNVFAELFHEARDKNGKLVFPLRITGTITNPKFALVD